jgi:hypothetical protein
LYQHTQKK